MENKTNSKNRRNSKKANFIVQGGILALAGIIVRVIGMVRRIPLANIIGDVGNAYYAAAYEVYSIILIISSYSLPLAVSKLVAARVSRKQYKNASRIFKGSLIFASITGGVSCIFVFLFSDYLAGKVMFEPMSAMALKVLAPTLFIVAIMGIFRGYFQGIGTMMPTALSQILEQVVLVIVSLIAADYLFEYGLKVSGLLQNENFAPAYGAAGATFGCAMGALFGLLFLLFIYSVYKKQIKKQLQRDTTKITESYSQIFRILIITIIPVLLSTFVYNLSNVIDQSIYNNVMIQKGMEEIKSLNWGVFSGKYRVLVNVPIALANAMCASIIPTLTSAISRGDSRMAKEKTGMVIRFTMIICIPCAVGLSVLGKPIVDLLFSGEIDLAAQMLQVGSISIVFYSLSTLSNGILQGINKMHIPVRNALISLILHIGLLYVMLEYMNLNIFAVVYANVFFSFLMCILNGLSIKKHMKYRQEYRKTFFTPAICAAIMGIVIFLLHKGTNKLIGNAGATTIAIIIGSCIYFILLILLKGVNERELGGIPGGRNLVKIAKAIRIM